MVGSGLSFLVLASWLGEVVLLRLSFTAAAIPPQGPCCHHKELLFCAYVAGARFLVSGVLPLISHPVYRCNGLLYSNIFLTEPKVTDVSVTKSVEDGNVTLNVFWTTPQSELHISKYEVECRTSDSESWINSTRLSVSPPANPTVLTGLDAGVEYIVRVRALSEIGAGAWSEEQRVRADDSECL